MTEKLSIALGQINPTVGDIHGNRDLILASRVEAAREGVDLIVFSELALSGYPPEDLVMRRSFLALVRAAAEKLAVATADGGPALLLGAPWAEGEKRYNAALLLADGEIKAVRYKHHLPNYGVFDEARFFHPGPLPEPVSFRGVSLGVMVCEDLWHKDVSAHLKGAGAEMLVVLNGSPFELAKHDHRLAHAQGRAAECGLPVVYVNQVGGQDELAFDGGSFVIGADGQIRQALPQWEVGAETAIWRKGDFATGSVSPPMEHSEMVYQALMVGLTDYVNKNGFPGIVLGLSGGIDSALSAAVAVDALGAERVRCVMMPSPYTSDESIEDAEAVGDLLGMELSRISIEPAMEAYHAMLDPIFAGLEPDITEENLQARARGITLMALSNKFGDMVLSTGNKSEMSVGYATLYGDMCGGYSVLKDVYKTTVFEISRWRNAHKPKNALGPDGPVMPPRVITKPPSAELKPDQTDQDTLPPYEDLDDILKGLIEEELGLAGLVARGHSEEVVQRVWAMVNRAEYKRRQAPPGVKITARAFGRDRRYPITDAFQVLT